MVRLCEMTEPKDKEMLSRDNYRQVHDLHLRIVFHFSIFFKQKADIVQLLPTYQILKQSIVLPFPRDPLSISVLSLLSVIYQFMDYHFQLSTLFIK